MIASSLMLAAAAALVPPAPQGVSAEVEEHTPDGSWSTVADPRLSADGRHMLHAYVSGADDIVVWHDDSRWPIGEADLIEESLAFVGTGQGAMWKVAPWDGGQRAVLSGRPVGPVAEQILGMAASPSGDALAVWGVEDGRHVVTVGEARVEADALTGPGVDPLDVFRWSADSTHVAFTDGRRIWRVSADGSDARSWSPDDSQAADSQAGQAGGRGGRSGRRRAPSAPPPPGFTWDGAVLSPDGQRLAFARSDSSLAVWDGEQVRELHGDFLRQMAAFSPSGDSLWSLDHDDRLYRDGEVVAESLERLANGTPVMHTGDGTPVYVTRLPDGRSRVHVGKEPHRPVANRILAAGLHLDASSSRVAFVGRTTGDRQIWMVDGRPAGSSPANPTAGVLFSQDGAHYAVMTMAGLVVDGVEFGGIEIARLGRPDWATFSSDGQRLWAWGKAMNALGQLASGLVLLDLETGGHRLIETPRNSGFLALASHPTAGGLVCLLRDPQDRSLTLYAPQGTTLRPLCAPIKSEATQLFRLGESPSMWWTGDAELALWLRASGVTRPDEGAPPIRESRPVPVELRFAWATTPVEAGPNRGPFAEFTPTTTEGELLALDDHLGRVLGIVIWDSSGPSRMALPKLRALYDEFHAEGFDLVGVHAPPLGSTTLFASANPWPEIVDGRQWAERCGLTPRPPEVWLIDRDGNLRPDPTHPSSMRAQLLSLLAEDR